jgi:hypothetical protein
MRRRTLAAAAALALLAVPATAAAHRDRDDDHGRKTARWDARAALKPVASPEDASGLAFLEQRDGALTVALKITKLDANTRYAARVQQGACAANGAEVVALPDLLTDEDGTARLWITLATAAGVNAAQTGLAVNVLAYGPAGAILPGVTCGAVDAPLGRAFGKVQPSVAGGTVKGDAYVKQGGGIARVDIRLKGLVPGSVHAQHIHLGSCAAQGGIVVPLPDAVADDEGEYRAILPVAGVTANVVGGGYYYNVHESPTPTVGAGIGCADLKALRKHGRSSWRWSPHFPW